MSESKVSYIEFHSADGLGKLELAEHYTGQGRFSAIEKLPQFIERKIQKQKYPIIRVGETPQPWFDLLGIRKYKLEFWHSMDIEGYPHLNKAVYKEVFDEPSTK